ncbi:ABC transporter ATP-binding protein [Rhodococcus sp. 15-649-1-2]|nr:ATP-binding cassette domain-containing protein [Rhodococcus sp. 15-649-1-2]OZE86289.1 ABC transporter ATP-binding protein [Rhodococcus sp. 15-649-1-2]
MYTDLRRALALFELRPARVATSVAAGVATLGSALTLAAVSAWLITRAWQMPPVLDLTVAVVAVRALGISRGVFRYLERLATHDTALRGMTSARTRLYERLADGNARATLDLRRGDLMARVGADIDAMGDVVVRALVPICVSAILMISATVLIALISPSAALILFLALLLAGVVAPILAARAALITETEGVAARTEFTLIAVRALDHAPELRVAGTLTRTLADASAANRAAVTARDRASMPTAFADAALPLSIGASVLGSLLVGISLYGSTGSALSPMALAIIVLVPLAAFEATSVLPAAAVTLTRARLSASRITALLDDADAPEPRRVGTGGALQGPHDAARIAVVGPSGVGKTTLLMELAGLVPSDSELGDAELPGARFFAEDAHVFETSILENLRVVRGDVDADQARAALTKVGLGDWLDQLPDGVDTTLVAGAASLSGGQRRRLLLARALLSDAPVLLLDEPTEHLDDVSGSDLIRRLLDRDGGLVDEDRTVVLVTHQLPPDTRADQVVDLGRSLSAELRKNPLRASKSGRTLSSTRERRWSEVEEL